MPRDASGNYSLVGGNPVVTGTVIESSWANNTLADLAQAMTESLSRNGEGGMLAPLGVPFGTALNASIFFSTHVNTGMYAVDNLSVSFTVNGVQTGQFVAPASGGFLANNQVTGGGLERVLTESDVGTLSAIYLPRDGSEDMTGILTIENLPVNGDHLIAGRMKITSSTFGSGSGSIGLINAGNSVNYGKLQFFTDRLDLFPSPNTTSSKLEMHPAGNVIQYSNNYRIRIPNTGNDYLQTTDFASGGLLVNNQLTGAGLERVLTVSDAAGLSTNVYPLTTDWAVNNDDNISSNVNWPIFNLPAGGVYRIKGMLLISDMAHGGFQFRLYLPDDVVQIAGWYFTKDASGAMRQKTQSQAIAISFPYFATAQDYAVMEFECLAFVPPSATSANVLPEFAQETAIVSAKNTTLLRGSYAEVTYLTPY